MILLWWWYLAGRQQNCRLLAWTLPGFVASHLRGCPQPVVVQVPLGPQENVMLLLSEQPLHDIPKGASGNSWGSGTPSALPGSAMAASVGVMLAC